MIKQKMGRFKLNDSPFWGTNTKIKFCNSKISRRSLFNFSLNRLEKIFSQMENFFFKINDSQHQLTSHLSFATINDTSLGETEISP